MAIPSPRYILAAKYQVFCAVGPHGRIMQVWSEPAGTTPEVIATDYPDPDICTTYLVCATNNLTEACRAWRDNANVCLTHADMLRTSVHTINPQLED
jgi:hypothetical protein